MIAASAAEKPARTASATPTGSHSVRAKPA
jgi:hypothetical protein